MMPVTCEPCPYLSVAVCSTELKFTSPTRRVPRPLSLKLPLSTTATVTPLP